MGEDGKVIYKIVVTYDDAVSEAEKAGKKIGDSVGEAADGSKNKSRAGLFSEIWVGAARKIGESFVELAGKAAGAVKSFVTDSINVGKEFDSAMSQISATLGYSKQDLEGNVEGAADNFKMLRDKAQEMGAATNFTATQAAEGLNILAMSGYDAEQSVAMIEDVLHLAAAGSMDMASAAGYISGAMKGFGDETKTSAYYADLMAKGATLANTSVSQLGEAMSSGAAGAAAYGQSADSMTVALLRLAEQGEVGSAAGTALSAAMKNLYAPTDQAAKALKKIGVSAYDSKGKTRDFNDVVNDLDAALNAAGEDGTAKYTEAQKNAIKQTIFGIQGLDAYNKMVVTSTDKQKQWADTLSTAGGESAQQYETMTDNLQGDLDILGSALDGLKIQISDAIMPTLREFVQFGSGALGKLADAFKKGGLTGAIKELGPILKEALGMINKLLPDTVKVGLEILRALVDSLVENLPTLIDGALMIITALVEMLCDGEMLSKLIDAAIVIIFALVNGLLKALPTLIDAAIYLIMALVEGLLKPETIEKLVEAAIQIVGALLIGLIKAIPLLLTFFPTLWKSLLQAFKEIKWGEIGKNIIDGVWNGIKNAWSGLVSKVKDAFSDLWGGVKDFLGIHSPSTKFKYIGEMTTEGTIEGIEDTEAEMTRTVRDVYSTIPDTAMNAMSTIPGMNARESFERDVSFNMTAAGKMSDMTIVVPLSLDGREVARATAWAMGEQLAWEEM